MDESLFLFREIGDQYGIAYSLGQLGNIACSQGNYAAAYAYLAESLTLYLRIGKRYAESYLLWFAEVAAKEKKMERAAVLWGAFEALRTKSGWSIPPHLRTRYDNDIADARQVLGEQAFAETWNRGHGMTLEEAIAYALEEPISALPKKGVISP